MLATTAFVSAANIISWSASLRGSATSWCVAWHSSAVAVLPGVQTPPGYQQPPYFMTGGPAQPALIAAAHPGGYHPAAPAPYGSYPGNNLQSYGSGPLPPMSSPRQTYGSGSSPSPGSATGGAYAGFLSPQQASNHTKPASSSFPANFDANSPYLVRPAIIVRPRA